MAKVIVDAGPLLAYFDRSATYHEWVRKQFESLSEPLLSCQAALSEVLFLLKRDRLNPDCILEMIEMGELLCDFDLNSEAHELRKFYRRYRDLPTSLADACLVRMSEIHDDNVIFTLDRDFLIYRRHGRQKIPLIAPFSR